MGYCKDYPMEKITLWEKLAGVRVPVDSYGHYLDHAGVSDDGKEAHRLTSPYGSLHFAVGFGPEDDEDPDLAGDTGDWMTCFDYAFLPDGRVILHSVVNSESGGFIQDGEYEVVAPEHALRAAVNMIALALQGVADNGGTHDEKGWNQDPYYFLRALAAALKVEPYASMSYDQRRFGAFQRRLHDNEREY
jgi:hypothetical protein